MSAPDARIGGVGTQTGEEGGAELAAYAVDPADPLWSEDVSLRVVALEPVAATLGTVTALARVVGIESEPLQGGSGWRAADAHGTLTVDGIHVDYVRSEVSSGTGTPPDASGATALLVAAVGAAGLDVDGVAFEVSADGTAAWTTPRASAGAPGADAGESAAEVVGDGAPGPDTWTMALDDDGIVALAGTLLRRTTTDLEVRAVTDVLGAGAPADGVTLRVVLQPDGDGWVPVASYVVRGPDGTEARPASWGRGS